MTPSSAKAKGRTLQKAVVSLLLAIFTRLTPRDVESTAMGQNGADVKLSQAGFEAFPFAIECKNIASFAGYGYYDQACEHSSRSGGIPLVVVKANNRDPLVIMSLEDFTDLISTTEEAV